MNSEKCTSFLPRWKSICRRQAGLSSWRDESSKNSERSHIEAVLFRQGHKENFDVPVNRAHKRFRLPPPDSGARRHPFCEVAPQQPKSKLLRTILTACIVAGYAYPAGQPNFPPKGTVVEPVSDLKRRESQQRMRSHSNGKAAIPGQSTASNSPLPRVSAP